MGQSQRQILTGHAQNAVRAPEAVHQEAGRGTPERCTGTMRLTLLEHGHTQQNYPLTIHFLHGK